MGMQEENPNIPNSKPESVVVPPMPTESNKVVEETPTSLDITNAANESSSAPTDGSDDKPKKNNKVLVVVGIIVLVLILAGIGYFTVSKNNSTSSPEPSPTPTASPEATPDPTADWETFEGAVYMFKYPKGYKTEETSDTNVSLLSGTSVFLQISSLETPTYDNHFICSDTKKEDCIQGRIKYPNTISEKYGDTLVSGKEAKDFYLKGGGPDNDYHVVEVTEQPTTTIIAFLGDIDLMEAEAKSNDKIFQQILSTFRFIGYEPDTDISNWTTSTPTNNKFRITHPKQLKAEVEKDSITLKYVGPTQREGTESYDGIFLKLDYDLLGENTLNEIVDSKIEESRAQSVSDIVEEKAPYSLNNHSGYDYTTKGLGIYHYIYLQSQGQSYIQILDSTETPSGQNYPEIVGLILSTFQFIE